MSLQISSALSNYATKPGLAQAGALPMAASLPMAAEPKRDSTATRIGQPTQLELEAAVARVAGALQVKASELRFSIDNDTGKAIVRITDKKTGEMIRQIPSVELMEIAKSLDRVQGLLLSQKA